jgi:hypothetical protein
VLVLPLTITLSPNHRPKPPSEHLNLDRESLWNVAFDSFPSAPFYIDVIVVDDLSNWGIIFHKYLIMHLAGRFQDQESKVIISHPEGGFFTLYREPLVGSLVETFDEPNDQLLCINNDIDNWFLQGGSHEDDTVKAPKGVWTLEFDGSHSIFGSGFRIVLNSPSNEAFYYSYRLDYQCTNKITEYEALILGINLAIDKDIEYLRVKGDSNLIVSQVLEYFATKNVKLKRYCDLAQSFSKYFKIVLIKSILGRKTTWLMLWQGPPLPYNLVMVHSEIYAKCNSFLDLLSLIIWRNGKSSKMMTKSLGSWKIAKNSPTLK